MAMNSGDDQEPDGSRTASTRREFFKKSALVCATATLGTKLAGAIAAGVGPVAADQDPKVAGPAAKPFPVVPFGSSEPIYLADFERCQPAGALAS